MVFRGIRKVLMAWFIEVLNFVSKVEMLDPEVKPNIQAKRKKETLILLFRSLTKPMVTYFLKQIVERIECCREKPTNTGKCLLLSFREGKMFACSPNAHSIFSASSIRI